MKVKPATYSSHTLLATTTQPSSKTGRPNFLSFSIRYYSKVKGRKCFKTQSITFFLLSLSLRTADALLVVASLFGGREATTRNASAVRRL